MQELLDYIKTQKKLGVTEEEIIKALKKAGYEDQEIDSHLKQAKKQLRRLTLETKHLLFMNIAAILLFIAVFVYISYDFHTKLAENKEDMKVTQEQIQTMIKAQQAKVDTDISTSENYLLEEITNLRKDMDEQDRIIRTNIAKVETDSKQRDASLAGSVQKVMNDSSTELGKLSGQITEVEENQVDFTKIVPDVIRSVVTIGENVNGFFTMSGTGAVISKNGQVVTNYHVIDELTKIKIRTSEQEIHEAAVVGYDEEWDIAVLQFTHNVSYPRLYWADSTKIYVGQPVIAIGHPQGLEESATQGIISNAYRYIPDVNVPFVQTDVAANEGNSGGPLINKEGKIVGIMARKYVGDGVEGLGFAIRCDDAQKAVARILMQV